MLPATLVDQLELRAFPTSWEWRPTIVEVRVEGLAEACPGAAGRP